MFYIWLESRASEGIHMCTISRPPAEWRVKSMAFPTQKKIPSSLSKSKRISGRQYRTSFLLRNCDVLRNCELRTFLVRRVWQNKKLKQSVWWICSKMKEERCEYYPFDGMLCNQQDEEAHWPWIWKGLFEEYICSQQ